MTQSTNKVMAISLSTLMYLSMDRGGRLVFNSKLSATTVDEIMTEDLRGLINKSFVLDRKTMIDRFLHPTCIQQKG